MAEFNACTGREFRQIILKEVEAALLEVHEFTSDAVTIPVARWQWKLTMDCYPRTPQTIEVQKTGARIATDATPEEMTSTQPFEMEGANAVGAEGMLAPDQARQQAGLPVPTLTTNRKLGVAHHEMVQSEPQSDEEAWRPAGTRSAVIDKGPRSRK